MGPKYKLTDETKTLANGIVLHRIEALRDGSWGPAGTLGGWIQSEENLSHYGNCWVYDEAEVYENVWVFGNAEVFDNARIYGNAWVYEEARVYGYAGVFGNAQVSENAMVSENAWVFGNAQVYGTADVHGHAQISGNTMVSGNQKVNGYCVLNGNEKGKKFKVKELCLCDCENGFLKEYHGYYWEISQVHEGWVQAKHGDEEIAFRNEWLRRV